MASRAWCNPPYSEIAPWAARMAAECQSGRLAEGLLLVPIWANDGWWHQSGPAADEMVSLSPRVAFIGPDGPLGSPPPWLHICLLVFRHIRLYQYPAMKFLHWKG